MNIKLLIPKWLICGFFLFSGYSFSQSNSENFRISYISTQPLEVVRDRAKAIQAEFSNRWSQGSVKPVLEFDIRHFEISPDGSNPLSVLDARNRLMVEDVVRSKPHVIYAAGAGAAVLAKQVTKDIPIVIGCACNPGPTSVRRLVMNLCAPEGNVTGFTRYDVRIVAPTAISACDPSANTKSVQLDSLFSRRLEILKNSKEPAIRRIALIYGEDFDEEKWQYDAKAKALGLTLIRLRLTEESIQNLPLLMQQAQAEAGLVFDDNLLGRSSGALIRITSSIPKPFIFPSDEADSGAWMHYGTKVDLAARAVDYFIPILQGKKISELPVGFPTEYELVVNHALAQRHGWVFPKRFLMLPQREAGAN